MKKIVILSFIGLTAMFLFNSCSKDDTGATVSIVGDWIQTGSAINGVSDWETDWDDCEKDNIISFLANGTFSVSEGPTKCDPNDPDVTDIGTWSLSADNKILTVNGFDIEVTLSSSTLLFEDSDGTDTFTSSYKRK